MALTLRSPFLVSCLTFAACGGGTTLVDGGGTDMGSSDAGPVDAAPVDGGSVDAGHADGGSPDGGAPDASGTDGGPRVPTFHRPDDSACTAAPPPGDCSFGGGTGMCSHDTDCTMGTNGRCNMNMGGAVFCRCTYDTCAHDTDCPTSQLCACHGAPLHPDSNECVPGNCRVDSDCGTNGYCSPSISPTGCGGLGGYYCHTATDTCVDDADCTTGLQACEYVAASNNWACVDRMFCP